EYITKYGCLTTFLSLKRANGAFQGAFSDSVEKAKSCPIIGGRFGASSRLILSVFAAVPAKRRFQLEPLL
ncbi:MAG: hypothetical protein Q7R35_13810, partial [Elusimicrobiota bacterium]|nr:hypothetical protein [Elusimicrobiota bacterium]